MALIGPRNSAPLIRDSIHTPAYQIKLETVFGLTVSSNAALDSDPHTELVAYPAGCTVVLYNVRKNRQSHVLNASRKSVTCVAFSPDGRYLATGECGHAPAVRVWDLQDPTASGAVQIAEFPGHTHGVNCVAFSTSSKYLVSVGSQHDMIVNVWDWRANLKLASNKVSSRVKAVSFSENGNYFVTVGFRHVKFWYLEYSRNNKFKEPVPLMGRSAILGEQKDNEFCDVACARGGSDATYAITRSGLLCQFNSRRLLDKWVELRTTSANCMSLGRSYIFVGCAEGIVRCFAPDTLRYVTTLPRAHYLGVDVSGGASISHMFSQPPEARYPDAVALTYDERNHKLTCVYNDHSLYVWDVRDIKRVGKSHSALYHSACIWGLDMVGQGPLGPGCFLSCSSDDTVRLWTLGGSSNIYSNELSKILYIDPELKFLKDVDLTATSDKDKSKTYDDKTGVRCVRVSPCGEHIAAGDRAGNVWVYDAQGTLLHTLEAHDAEVLCLEYSCQPQLLASASRDRLVHVFSVDKGYQILQTLDEHSSSITAVRFLSSGAGLQLVSCGADKTILFRQLRTNPDGSFQFQRGQNVSGRSTLYDMEVDAGGRHVLTACQDRNVRVYSAAHGRHTKTFRGTTAEDGTLIKVALDSSGIYLATSSTDKLLSVYDYYSGECMATMYGHSEIVTGLKFTPDCQHLISASGDGCMFVWRVPHDMVVTMRARLAQQAIRHGRKAPTNGASVPSSETESYWGSPPRDVPGAAETFMAPVVPDYTLRVGRLPSWAKKSLGDELVSGGPPAAPPASAPAPAAAPVPLARGKWATRILPPSDKRVDSDGSKDSSIDSGTDTRYHDRRHKQRPKSLNLYQLPRVEALFRNFDANMRATHDILSISPRVEKVTLSLTQARPEARTRHHTDDSSLGSLKFEDQESTEHDGDVEDISDGERTSSSERGRPTYYPGNNDDEVPSEFLVNAMDAAELRQSVRRARRWAAPPPASPAPPSLTGSPRDSDDDEVSTPSGDNADRNPLSGSCESLDTVGRREKYIKSAFDSLSGVDGDTPQAGNRSLSSQHRAPRDPDAARRREELQRRIHETRRQLETVAFRSNLKSSQSTTDLSYIPEKDGSRRTRPLSMAVTSNNRQFARNLLSPEEETGMRRAISLSDLAAKPVPAPRTPQGASKPAQPSPNGKSPSGFVRPAPRYNGKSNMTRSSSVGVLNQSDSESDPPHRTQAASSRSGLMRPTISSANKAAANTARRRGLANAYSTASVARSESSSEAEGEAPRPRAASADRAQRKIGGRSGSERDISSKAREVTARLTSRQRPKPENAGDNNMSPSALCAALTEQLTRTAGKVAALYRALQDDPRSDGDISGLEAAILETQKVLRNAVSQNGEEAASKVEHSAKDVSPGHPAMSLIEQYSDMLLNMMQNKMVNQFSQSPQSLPPTAGEES
ncbi:mitogen-activated protein kinase-binding protein 1-like isoform X3 [Danaus plexippus]|uniref:mitogen-activated protein kinase-binding protein 1-like isoform X3 n=1 Tax=Danaus plexippus TaxID=13037 RepID=UPI002AAF2580|nr:mitogen-activated protein kinase-binding protein 1-like isoform X3 [Danaus plexippus]XP_061381547.1 mitogen-activated protein kinase-binding protein 1-like isoform X3 [Danaus plexippus]XP_061381548.1 mitogen-activated protein kinase-binding protein 1-like isoform X3 [Danaus plexippus]XP_061381549.1 mitogen-activated protein kinase-binding protein 1-like isoform X3 [Danaus plexippus]XP_061381550.1 mitogen-activated protein kinase-binding protein 1-like isoform X3 [Danaus plexippus]